jgi:hypothetical protein
MINEAEGSAKTLRGVVEQWIATLGSMVRKKSRAEAILSYKDEYLMAPKTICYGKL